MTDEPKSENMPKKIFGGKKWGGVIIASAFASINSMIDDGIPESIVIWIIKLFMVFIIAEAFIDGAHAFARAFGENREKVKNGHTLPPAAPLDPARPGGPSRTEGQG